MPMACNLDNTRKKQIRDADIVFWGEITMMNSTICNSVNKLFQSIRNNKEPFDGCRIVFCGDFRQCLPVILDNPPLTQYYKHSILCSDFAPNIHFLRLFENMRLKKKERNKVPKT